MARTAADGNRSGGRVEKAEMETVSTAPVAVPLQHDVRILLYSTPRLDQRLDPLNQALDSIR
jgi:hypothetical protein